MQEEWIRWEPIAGLAAKYYVESISENFKDGFKILLFLSGDRDQKVLVHFPESVDAYRNTDESFSLKIMSDLGKQYGTEFYGRWTFFKATHSAYLQWLSETSFGIADDMGRKHFCFITVDAIVDVINAMDPIVTMYKV